MLCSGGLDSAMLLVEEADHSEVQPLYISVGLAWEEAEGTTIARFLRAMRTRHTVRPLIRLTLDMTDVYAAGHWALEGRPPDYHTPDEDVYLPGRNVVLIAKAGVFCASAGIPRLAIGTLAGNPFPDATPAFRHAMAGAITLGLQHVFEIVAPYESLHKEDVIRRAVGRGVPLDLTLSCMSPVATREGPAHCGLCSKCRERHEAFTAAGHQDPTLYHDRRHVGC